MRINIDFYVGWGGAVITNCSELSSLLVLRASQASQQIGVVQSFIDFNVGWGGAVITNCSELLVTPGDASIASTPTNSGTVFDPALEI